MHLHSNVTVSLECDYSFSGITTLIPSPSMANRLKITAKTAKIPTFNLGVTLLLEFLPSPESEGKKMGEKKEFNKNLKL